MFREQKRTKVSSSEYGVTVAAFYLKCHTVQWHGVSAPQTRGVDKGGGEPGTYVVSFPRVLKTVKYPVPGCMAVVHSAGHLYEQFMY